MKDKCCRYSRLLSYVCVKCMNYRDNERLKRSSLNEQLKLSMLKEEIECIHGNESTLCATCSIQYRDQMSTYNSN